MAPAKRIAGMALVLAFAGVMAPAAPVQVWNVERWQTVSAGDFSGANPAMGSPRPVALMAARNGVCSGFVVVTRDGEAIGKLRAVAGDLAQANGAGRISADRIQVRVAAPVNRQQSWMPAERYDRLREKLPVDVPAVDLAKLQSRSFKPRVAATVATAPLWVTVRVPAEARPGHYAGVLTVTADGLAAVRVPLELTVHDWLMPDPRDFQVRTIGWMNPEALAKHYAIELWSERHFELMGQSMTRMLELGSRHLAIDVGQNFPARDNADTMIKWVKRPDGKYGYDFTLFDRYCDLAAQKIGKPFPLRLNLWRGPRNGGGGEATDYPHTRVLAIDPATKQSAALEGPTKLGSPEMKAFWQPVMDELRARLEKRNWFEVTGIGWMCYCGGMTKDLAGMVDEIWPGARWTDVTHGRVLRYQLPKEGAFARIISGSTVWNEGTLGAYEKWSAGPYPRQYANLFKPDTAFCTHARNQYRESSVPLLWTLRTKHEEAVFKGNQGLECVGADHFPFKDARGAYRAGVWSAFAQGPANATLALLGAGDDGLLGTERYEAMREGIQLCEALVFIQKAIEAGSVSGDLLTRANRLLDDRAKAFVGCLLYEEVDARGRKERRQSGVDFEKYDKLIRPFDAALFDLAGEVARATAAGRSR